MRYSRAVARAAVAGAGLLALAALSPRVRGIAERPYCDTREIRVGEAIELPNRAYGTKIRMRLERVSPDSKQVRWESTAYAAPSIETRRNGFLVADRKDGKSIAMYQIVFDEGASDSVIAHYGTGCAGLQER